MAIAITVHDIEEVSVTAHSDFVTVRFSSRLDTVTLFFRNLEEVRKILTTAVESINTPEEAL